MCYISKLIFPCVSWLIAKSTEQLYVLSFLIPKGHCSGSFLQMWALLEEGLCCPSAGAIQAVWLTWRWLPWEKRGHCSHFHDQICLPNFGHHGPNETALIHKGGSALLPCLVILLSVGEDNCIHQTLCKQEYKPLFTVCGLDGWRWKDLIMVLQWHAQISRTLLCHDWSDFEWNIYRWVSNKHPTGLICHWLFISKWP